ncbi:CoA-binding protein [Candidatus Sumerlaeota bacterium]|nr:CoA-binding protein [Candidatus Sumerlaeota bacterium]
MTDAERTKLLAGARTIAVVGLSDNPMRDSHHVAEYLQGKGYRIIPVNPAIAETLGEKSYPSLASVPEKIDIVDIFRKSEFVPPIVDEAIRIGAQAVWMQDGVIHDAAADKARAAGLAVVMNDCILREHRRLIG